MSQRRRSREAEVERLFGWMRASRAQVSPEAEGGVVFTHYGDHRGFRNRPRFEEYCRQKDGTDAGEPEISMSVIEGELTPQEACRAIFGRVTRSKASRARARYATCVALAAEELAVYRTPSANNPQHASVEPSPELGLVDSDLARHKEFWDDRGSTQFDSAFEEVTHDDH